MSETPSKMHMYDMMTIDTTVFEIVGEALNFFKYPRSD